MKWMELFLRNRSTAVLTDQERERLETAVAERRGMPARAILLDRGEHLCQSTMLVTGFMIRYIDDTEGRRQIVAFHVLGDFVDLHAFPLHVLNHSIATLTQVEIGIVPHGALRRLTAEDPDLAQKLWGSTLLDAAMHRE